MEKLVMEHCFNGIYKGKKVFLTGHTGFKGSWLYTWLKALGAEVTGYSLAPITDPAHFLLLNPHEHSFIEDIRNAEALNEAVSASQPDIVFHLAAQPLVRKSYALPVETFETNIQGTVNLLDSIRRQPGVKAMVNITTDKVYRNTGGTVAYKETDTLGGHDPYSTSKACVELVHESYQKSYFKEAGIRSATVRAGNVIGGGDWSEDRLIPDIAKAAAQKSVAPVRYPQAVRPWQHVLDPLSGYLLLGMHLLQGDEEKDGAWNFGPALEDCLPVIDVLNKFSAYWPDVKWKDVSSMTQPHESATLRLDCDKASRKLNWKPVWNINEAIEHTAAWYREYYKEGKLFTRQNLDLYLSDAARCKAVWI